jgi:hypothetical protein
MFPKPSRVRSWLAGVGGVVVSDADAPGDSLPRGGKMNWKINIINKKSDFMCSTTINPLKTKRIWFI